MNSLELKVPPPLVAATLAAAMWGVSLFAPHIQLQSVVRVLAAATIAVLGVAFTIAGIASFRRAKTTVSPLKPDSASSLVSSGVYTITRNPMYVGLLFVLVGWAVFLSSPLALVGPLAFFLYIGRFQIAPEERALSNLFGSDYANYRARVRRWL
jgi:protein-S-isoprenylcysteine O-methyltransferase Ste14